MGTTSGTNYHPTTLVQLPSKGNRWFVQATLPKPLQGKNKQKRVSTGTSDRKLAERLQHEITKQIYDGFDEQLEKLTVNDSGSTLPFASFTMTEEQSQIYRLVHPEKVLAAMTLHEKEKQGPQLGELLEQFLASREWARLKTLKEHETYIKQFVELIGNFSVSRIRKVHAYDYAQILSDQGYANKTIGSRISKVTAILKYCERRGLIEANPFVNLDLTSYGRPKVSYAPYDLDDLKAIFAQKIQRREKLLFTLLCTTGARLDEIALLRWDQIKKHGRVTYLDLRDAELIKNDSSRRLAPLHPNVDLPKQNSERVFNYSLDQDGKAATNAGYNGRPYLEIITHPKKVIHSFRGTFKDMMRDIECPEDVHDWITGHGAGDVNKGYGRGPSLKVRHDWVSKLDLGFIGES